MFLIDVNGANAAIRRKDTLTAGMVGATIKFRFNSDWYGLTKTAVFRANGVARDKIWTGTAMSIPPEVLVTYGVPLEVGVYGSSSDGKIVIPTVWIRLGNIYKGTELSGDTPEEPTPDLWTQMLGMIGDLSGLNTTTKTSLVAAINEVAALGGGELDPAYVQSVIDKALQKAKDSGEFDGASVRVEYKAPVLTIASGDETVEIDFSEFFVQGDVQGGYYTPHVDEIGNLTWTASEEGMPEVGVSNIRGPKGNTGNPGKTPVKGTDYFTEEDKASIVDDVVERWQALSRLDLSGLHEGVWVEHFSDGTSATHKNEYDENGNVIKVDGIELEWPGVI